jgi:hypothetical protein
VLVAAILVQSSMADAQQCIQGRLIKAAEPDKTIWAVTAEGKLAIAGWSSFTRCGYNFSKVETVDQSQLDSLPVAGVIALDGVSVSRNRHYLENGRRKT